MLAVRIDLLLHINNNTNERMCGTLCVLDNKGENDEYVDYINQSMCSLCSFVPSQRSQR